MEIPVVYAIKDLVLMKIAENLFLHTRQGFARFLPGLESISMLKACILPKSLTKWGGIFIVNLFHAYDQIDM